MYVLLKSGGRLFWDSFAQENLKNLKKNNDKKEYMLFPQEVERSSYLGDKNWGEKKPFG